MTPPMRAHTHVRAHTPQGQGQVIGMGDTGLDMNHCMLSDPAVPFNVSGIEPGTGIRFFANATHRKV